jgi:y4mF family transcriptional regulator
MINFIIFAPVRDDFNVFIRRYTRTGCSSKLITMDLGKYIAEKRALHKLTQLELAERSGVGVRFVRELEHGKPTVQLDKVNQVLSLFGEEMVPGKISNV